MHPCSISIVSCTNPKHSPILVKINSVPAKTNKLFHSATLPITQSLPSQISSSFLSNYCVTLLHFSSKHVCLYHLYLTSVALEYLTSFSSSQNKTWLVQKDWWLQSYLQLEIFHGAPALLYVTLATLQDLKDTEVIEAGGNLGTWKMSQTRKSHYC